MADSTHLRLPYIEANQAQKHVTHNEAVRLLDALVQMAVISRTVTTSPASPADGDRYIVAAGATGAWATWDLNIAYYVDGAWMKLIPQTGWLAWIEAEATHVRWDGSAWGGLSSGGSVAWGSITGTLSSQTDLQTALNGKAAVSHTHPAAEISDSTAAGRTMLTAADAAAQTALLNAFTSTLKGLAPASGGGTSAFLRADGSWTTITTANINNNAITNAKLATVTSAIFKGRLTAGTGNVEDLTGTQATTLLDTFTSTLKGLVPASGGGTVNFLRADGTWAAPPAGGSATWGSITGTLSAQADLQIALDAKQPLDADLTTIASLTAATDSFMQVKAGAWAARTIAQVKADLGLTGTNSGDQTITLTGDVTGSGTGSFAATIGANVVTNAKLAAMATASFKGRTTAGTGNVEDLTAAQATALLNTYTTTLKGLAPASGGGTVNFLRADGTWVPPPDPTALQNLSLLGVNATADATNKFAVASSAILFNNVGNGVQVKVNKAAAADTASFLFQTSFSGRAEFGTTGDDDFHFKVSPDGSAWTEALLINRTTGIVTLTNNSVANAALADMATNRFKGRTTAGVGDPEDLTGTQATVLLDVFTSALKGLAPASGGGTTNFLRADGTWVAPAGGGGSGDVVGPASATDNALARFDTTTGKLIQNGVILATDNGELILPYVATPAAPGTDKLNMFAGKKATRMLPRFMGPSGLDVTLQPLIAANKIAWWNPPGNATTVPGVLGIAAPTAVGTATARNVAATNLATRARRMGYVSAATAGSLSGHHSATAQFTIGATGGIGGFFYVCRFVVSDAAAVSGARMFVGLRNAVTAPTNVEPNTLTNYVGVSQLSPSNNLQIVYGGSAAQTAIDLGASFPANTLSADLYELALFAPPDTQVIYYQVTHVNTGDTATGTLSGTVGTVIPAATTFLAHTAWRCNNTTALAVGIDVVSIYIETDN